MKVATHNQQYKTAKAWLEAGRVPKDGAKGVKMWANQFCGQIATYYLIDDTREAAAEELEELINQEKEKKRAYRRKLYRDRRAKEAPWRNIQLLTKKCTKKPTENTAQHDIVVFDTETTGLDPKTNEILQFSAIDGAGNVLLNTYIKPQYHNSWTEAEKINGITWETVQNAPTLEELAGKIRGIMASAALLIAYNGIFDLEFLHQIGYEQGETQTYYDVMREFAPIYGEWNEKRGGYKWQKLTKCAEYYGYTFQAHDSLEDCRATLHCYRCMTEQPQEKEMK